MRQLCGCAQSGERLPQRLCERPQSRCWHNFHKARRTLFSALAYRECLLLNADARQFPIHPSEITCPPENKEKVLSSSDWRIWTAWPFRGEVRALILHPTPSHTVSTRTLISRFASGHDGFAAHREPPFPQRPEWLLAAWNSHRRIN